MGKVRENSFERWKEDKESQDFIKDLVGKIMHVDPKEKINKNALYSKDSKTVGANLTRLF